MNKINSGLGRLAVSGLAVMLGGCVQPRGADVSPQPAETPYFTTFRVQEGTNQLYIAAFDRGKNAEMRRVELYQDGVLTETFANPRYVHQDGLFAGTVTTPGTYTLHAVAYDADGNSTRSETITVGD